MSSQTDELEETQITVSDLPLVFKVSQFNANWRRNLLNYFYGRICRQIIIISD